MKSVKEAMSLYFVSGTTTTKGDVLDVLEKACMAGITCFQLREKGKGALEGEAKLDLAKACQALCHKYDVMYIIDDDVDLAVKIGADGLHVGQGDMPLPEVRQVWSGILGISVNNLDELSRTPIELVDYIGVGPMYATQTKEDAKTVRGPEGLSVIRKAVGSVPIVGIGGIKAHNATPVLEAGADGIAVVTAISHAEDPAKATKELLAIIHS